MDSNRGAGVGSATSRVRSPWGENVAPLLREIRFSSFWALTFDWSAKRKWTWLRFRSIPWICSSRLSSRRRAYRNRFSTGSGYWPKRSTSSWRSPSSSEASRGGRNALVHPQPLARVRDVRLRDPDVEVEVDAGRDLLLGFLAAQFLHRVLEQLAVEIEPDRVDVPVLLAAEQVAGAADLQIECGDPESGAQVAELADGRQALARHFRQDLVGGDEEVGVGPAVAAADAAAQLVQLRQAVQVRAVDDDRVDARDVEAVFDDGGRDQHVELVLHEPQHDAVPGPARTSGRGPRRCAPAARAAAPWRRSSGSSPRGCARSRPGRCGPAPARWPSG